MNNGRLYHISKEYKENHRTKNKDLTFVVLPCLKPEIGNRIRVGYLFMAPVRCLSHYKQLGLFTCFPTLSLNW